MVERARIVLACLEGKEIQQVARETGASVPTISKWRKRFAQDGVRGLRDQPRSGKPSPQVRLRQVTPSLISTTTESPSSNRVLATRVMR